MDRNIKIARELVRIAKELSAANMDGKKYDESFKFFVIWYDKNNRPWVDSGYAFMLEADVRAGIIADHKGFKSDVITKEQAAKYGIDLTNEKNWEYLGK